jgi:hypothetical protein
LLGEGFLVVLDVENGGFSVIVADEFNVIIIAGFVLKEFSSPGDDIVRCMVRRGNGGFRGRLELNRRIFMIGFIQTFKNEGRVLGDFEVFWGF